MQRGDRRVSVGCWPNERQTLLLRAALWEDERALRAWDQWRARSPLERVDGSDVSLLGAAYRRLRRLRIDDPRLSIAGGIYRRNWYLNQLALRRAAQVVDDLRGAGLDVLVLKGAALALLHYRDAGARAMKDVDVLIGPGNIDAAVDTLLPSGWWVVETQGPVGGPLRYGLHVRDEDENEVDLHEYALMQSVDDSDLWATRIPLDLMGTPTAALAPTEQLLHVCAHGMRWDEATTLWALDAMTILRSAGSELDWQRFVERARARRLTVALGDALAWLRESLEAEIPQWVLAELRSGPRLRFERAVHRVTTQPPTSLGFALMSFDRYRRFARLAPVERRPRSFADYLRASWELERPTQVLIYGGRKLAGRRGAASNISARPVR
jgi:hypothetical protein